MISLQAKIILAILAFVLVASGLTIWFILAWGNGFWAMIAPLVVAAVVAVATRVATRDMMEEDEG